MTDIAEETQIRERLRQIEGLLQDVEKFKDPQARAKTREIIKILMDIHGSGLERLLEHLADTGEAGLAMIDTIAEDEAVSSLLLLYGLHPIDFETRVLSALEQVRPYLSSHGGNVELLGTEDGVVRLRLQGSCHGCPSSAVTLKQTIEEAICEKAPDAVSIVVEQETVEQEVAEPTLTTRSNHFALPILQVSR